MPIAFLAAKSEELQDRISWDELFDSPEKYKVEAGYGDFEIVYEISKLFFQDETHIPIETKLTLLDDSKIYQYNQEFVSKITSFEREELENSGYELIQFKYCRENDMDGLGLLNSLFGLYGCCQYAISEDKNLYLIVENSI